MTFRNDPYKANLLTNADGNLVILGGSCSRYCLGALLLGLCASLPSSQSAFGALTPTILTGSLFAPPVWSPNGCEVLWLTETGEAQLLFPAGWLFGPLAESKAGLQQRKRARSQLWIASRTHRSPRLVIETRGTLSTPAWAPDGKSLAYTLFEPTLQQPMPRADSPVLIPGVLSLRRTHRVGKTEVLYRQAGAFPADELSRLHYQRTAWSANGLYLAAAWCHPERLLVYSLSQKRLETELHDACLPSWSPDGSYLACVHTDEEVEIRLIPVGHWTAAIHAAHAQGVRQPAWWEGHGQALYVGRRRLVPNKNVGRQAGGQMEIVRVAVSDFSQRVVHQVDLSHKLESEPSGCSFAFDEANETLFVTAWQDSPFPTMVEWVSLTSGRVHRIWNPIDPSVSDRQIPIGGLAVPPDGGVLAFRFGGPHWGAPLAILEAGQSRVAHLVAGETSRMSALQTIALATKRAVLERDERAQILQPPRGPGSHQKRPPPPAS